MKSLSYKLKHPLSLLLSIAMIASCMAYAYATDDGTITDTNTDTTTADTSQTSSQKLTSGGAASIPVTITASPITIDVTVPTAMPVVIDSEGKVTTATNAVLTNNSTGEIQIKKIEVQPGEAPDGNGTWKLVSFDKIFTRFATDTYEFGMQINGINVTTDGLVDLSKFETTIVEGYGSTNNTLAIDYDANVAFQHKALADKDMAQVLITVNWYDPLGEAREAAKAAGVGGTIQLNIKNSSGKYSAVNFKVVNIGNPDPTIYDDSCDGYWLLSEDCIQDKVKWGTLNDYANSSIKSILDNLASSFEITIPEVKIPYYAGNTDSGTVKIGEDGLPVKLFLLSSKEVNNVTYETYRDILPGAALQYFDKDSSDLRLAYNTTRTEYIDWWLRSPGTTYNSYAFYVDDDGTMGNFGVSNTRSIRVALII